ncbi:hypothetical protein Hypma_004238 [Hypsizygus marmoreus]|uniref:Uncharacterized protein n=1 Tax=Hypsizygus marmoreus TaxID=39966 RepID=A0A369J9A0_HYPMA|nr:hypothetical protein Hypma_004238 [Hypsizygus marmoreus]
MNDRHLGYDATMDIWVLRAGPREREEQDSSAMSDPGILPLEMDRILVSTSSEFQIITPLDHLLVTSPTSRHRHSDHGPTMRTSLIFGYFPSIERFSRVAAHSQPLTVRAVVLARPVSWDIYSWMTQIHRTPSPRHLSWLRLHKCPSPNRFLSVSPTRAQCMVLFMDVVWACWVGRNQGSGSDLVVACPWGDDKMEGFWRRQDEDKDTTTIACTSLSSSFITSLVVARKMSPKGERSSNEVDSQYTCCHIDTSFPRNSNLLGCNM